MISERSDTAIMASENSEFHIHILEYIQIEKLM